MSTETPFESSIEEFISELAVEKHLIDEERVRLSQILKKLKITSMDRLMEIWKSDSDKILNIFSEDDVYLSVAFKNFMKSFKLKTDRDKHADLICKKTPAPSSLIWELDN